NIVSPIPAVKSFGLFMGTMVLVCWVLVVILIPPALTLWHLYLPKVAPKFFTWMRNAIDKLIKIKQNKSAKKVMPVDIHVTGNSKDGNLKNDSTESGIVNQEFPNHVNENVQAQSKAEHKVNSSIEKNLIPISENVNKLDSVEVHDQNFKTEKASEIISSNDNNDERSNFEERGGGDTKLNQSAENMNKIEKSTPETVEIQSPAQIKSTTDNSANDQPNDIKRNSGCCLQMKNFFDRAHKRALYLIDKLTMLIIKVRWVLMLVWLALLGTAIAGIINMKISSDIPKIFSGKNRVEEAILLRQQNAYVPDDDCYECAPLLLQSPDFFESNTEKWERQARTIYSPYNARTQRVLRYPGGYHWRFLTNV
ncbi:uncharacterized protein LOC142356335, partial [Convolutriloba macropyga]|uniref:uncharacterized protein LOC142356335 n=1 Tax=Convolutriloba macropyga TaxID=536237 RepID=UPI003F5215D8